ncbi:Parallel beta-helix repeat [Fusarium oxysporum f. sp. vasinfectum]|nr:Parallel beta-helix repeat [Fusarium oxysporum f. sp. vasinfectum]
MPKYGHSGSTIGGEVLDVLHTLGLSPEKIGYFTLDNAENNYTAMEVIGAELGFNGRLRRGRCIGHIINLSAKAILFGKNADAFEQQLSSAEALSDTEYARWRKKGPVGKLHNIVVDVRISHRLIYLFKEVQRDEIDRAATLKLRSKKPLKLIIDNDTRWLSQLYMIRRALRLKTSIELLLVKYKAQWEDENRSEKTGQVTQAKLAKKPRILRDENQLTDKDWEVLYHLEAILTVFETVVKTLEGDGHMRTRKQGWTGSYGNIWDVVLGYELLLNTLEEYKQLAADFPDPEHFHIGINLAWDKLDEYYRRLDETPIYYTAMALHPAYRWDWFDETWAHKPSWVEKAKEMVADVWLSDYAHLEVRTSSSRGDDEPPAKRPRFFNPFEKNSRVPNSLPAHAAAIVGDEYQAWQTDRDASDGNVRDPIGYWITKQSRYPRLSRMALDFLTIQPMSAEYERLFSAAGKMVSGLRTNLDAEIIAICQVLRSWYRAGLIKDLDPLFKSHLESKHDAGCGTLSDGELALAVTKWLLEGEDSVSEVDDISQQQQAEELVSTSESVTKNEKGVDTDAGICIAVYNVKKAPFQAEHARAVSVGKPVKGVSVTGFDVRGFSGVNVVVIGAKNTNVYKNKLTDAPAYGALTLGSYNTVFSENIITTTQGGFIGICMDNYSDVLTKKNEISKVFIGLCVQTDGAVLAYNNLHDNCDGIYVDPGVRGVQLIHNHISKSGPAAACGGSTAGITLDGASDIVVRDNVIEGQHADAKGTGVLIFYDECKATPQGGLSLSCITFAHKAVAKDNVVIRNTLRDNDVDIVNSSKGSGNMIKCNTCETPANLKAGQCHKNS